MARRPRKLLIFLTVLLDLVSFGIVIPLLPTFAEDLGATLLQIGLLVGTHSFVQFLVGPMFGALSDRIGRRPILLGTVLGNCLAYVLLARAETLPLLFLARAASGASAANIATASAYLSDITSRAERGAAMGLIGAAFGLGFVIGPALAGVFSSPWGGLGFTSDFNATTPYWIAAGLSLANFVWIAFCLPESLPPEQRDRSSGSSFNPLERFALIGRVNPAFRRLLLGYFLTITAFSVMTTLFALFNEFRFGFGDRQNGLMFALIGLVGVLIQGGMLRRLEPRLGARRLITLGTMILALSLFALPLANAVWLLVATSVAIAVGNSFAQPSLNTAASRLADPTIQGATLGLVASAGSLGRVVGPAISGPLMEVEGKGKNFGTTALLVSGGIMVVAWFMLRRLPTGADAEPTSSVAAQEES